MGGQQDDLLALLASLAGYHLHVASLKSTDAKQVFSIHEDSMAAINEADSIDPGCELTTLCKGLLSFSSPDQENHEAQLNIAAGHFNLVLDRFPLVIHLILFYFVRRSR